MELVKNPIVVLDADVTVYISAYACENKSLMLMPDGLLKCHTFYYAQTHGYSIINSQIDRLREDLLPKSIIVVLSSSDNKSNYRSYVQHAAREYKKNRAERPYYYNHMRSYFINNYNAMVCNKDEADDAIGKLIYDDYNNALINDGKISVVSCSIDKDFKQFPGYLYNLKTRETNYSDFIGFLTYKKGSGIDGRGFLFFCAQMLMGDTADNIVGIHRVGQKKAYDALFDAKSYRDAWSRVVKMYREKGISDRQIRAHATLLWITHEEGRLLPHSHLVEHLL